MPPEEVTAIIQDAVQNATSEATGSVDVALIIAIIALIVSALSPIISSVIGGTYQLKAAKMEAEEELKRKQLEIDAEAKRRYHEFYEQHRAAVIERYINAVGKAAQNFAVGNRQEFGESMGEIYMYVDQSLWPLLDSIAGKINKHTPSDPSAELKELCKKLTVDSVRPKHEVNPNSTNI